MNTDTVNILIQKHRKVSRRGMNRLMSAAVKTGSENQFLVKNFLEFDSNLEKR